MSRIATCLWFDDQAEAAAALYTGLLPNSRVTKVAHTLEGGPRPAGSVMTVEFELDGTAFIALNGGPHFQHSPAMSIVAWCDSQAEIDRLWKALGDGGQESPCGWLSDRYGVSWQIVPRVLPELLDAQDRAAARRAMDAMTRMKKLDLAALRGAFEGG